MTDDETEFVMKFPELPEPFEIWEQWGQNVDVYTAAQMQQYGKACAKDALRAVERAARAAEREACAQVAAAPQPTLTVLDLQQALVDTGIIFPEAIDDAEGYDHGVTLERIDELHKMLTQPAPDALREAA